eukprot:TRINITY_DN632_c0_g1_i1.p1 TRINITY_DN632_c0_g1~~TRINITY_DN632_c0_g1_i1.p1  ORF type:complete len:299 (+),score=51.52 TRINITY_DN632_c0_g1_i1:925-1821(+)
MNSFTGLADFPLKFLKASDRKAVRLQFLTTVQLVGPQQNVSLSVQSECSDPFFIICHQSQFEACEGELLKKKAFGDIPSTTNTITWPNLANHLQRQFLRGTKQDHNDPNIRCLSTNDLNYFHGKFFGCRNRISQAEFDAFWEWYSKIIHVFRYTRYIVQLWQLGLICPFLARNQVDEVLEMVEGGTFLLRFSESYPGQFTISHIQQENQIRQTNHYLVQPKDTARNSLPEFIRDKDLLSKIVQVGVTDPRTGAFTFNVIHKNIAFQGFYKTQRAPPPPLEKEVVHYQKDAKLLHSTPL